MVKEAIGLAWDLLAALGTFSFILAIIGYAWGYFA